MALEHTGRLAEAEAAYRRSLALAPGYAEVRNNLGNCLRKQGRIDEAVAEHREAIRLKPAYYPAYNNLEASLLEQAEVEQAAECDRRVVQLCPGDAAAHSALLYNLHYDWRPDAAAVFAEHLRWSERQEDALSGQICTHENDPDPAKRLRVGYVSADFRKHPVATFQEAAFARRDRDRFEVFCYSDVARPDPTTARLQSYVDVLAADARNAGRATRGPNPFGSHRRSGRFGRSRGRQSSICLRPPACPSAGDV